MPSRYHATTVYFRDLSEEESIQDILRNGDGQRIRSVEYMEESDDSLYTDIWTDCREVLVNTIGPNTPGGVVREFNTTQIVMDHQYHTGCAKIIREHPNGEKFLKWAGGLFGSFHGKSWVELVGDDLVAYIGYREKGIVKSDVSAAAFILRSPRLLNLILKNIDGAKTNSQITLKVMRIFVEFGLRMKPYENERYKSAYVPKSFERDTELENLLSGGIGSSNLDLLALWLFVRKEVIANYKHFDDANNGPSTSLGNGTARYVSFIPFIEKFIKTKEDMVNFSSALSSEVLKEKVRNEWMKFMKKKRELSKSNT